MITNTPPAFRNTGRRDFLIGNSDTREPIQRRSQNVSRLIGGMLTALLAGATLAQGTHGDLDEEFSGFESSLPGVGFGWVNSMAVQPDGKVLIAGLFGTVNGQARRSIARLNVDGSLDTSFPMPSSELWGPYWEAVYEIHSLAVQQDGKVLIGGSIDGVRLITDRYLPSNINRLNADGSQDPSFVSKDSGLGARGGAVRSVAVQANGKILLGGEFTTVHMQSRNGIARLNADGSLDEAFQAGVTGVFNSTYPPAVNSLALQPDGKVLLGGEFTSVNGEARHCVARLNADGTLDTGFLGGLAPGDDDIRDWVSSIVLQPNGKILIGGDFKSVNGEARSGVARLNADGSLDMDFMRDVAGVDGTVRSLALQSDGKVMIGGQFWTVNGEERVALAKLNADGSLDSNFVVPYDPLSWPHEVNSFSVQSDGRLLVGGFFKKLAGHRCNGIARLNADGDVDTGFLTGAVVANDWITSLAPYENGRLLIGGDFIHIEAGQPHIGLLHESSGGFDMNFMWSSGLFANDIVEALYVQSDGKVLIGGAFTDVNGQGRNRIARLNADGSLDTGFLSGQQGASGVVHSLDLQSDEKVLVGGAFTRVNGVGRNRVARLHADGSLDTGFLSGQQGANDLVYSIEVQPDGKVLIGGGFTSVNGQARGGVARLNADGILDAGFLSGQVAANGVVRSLALQPDGKVLLGGEFTTVNGHTRNGIARLNADGSTDSSFVSSLGGSSPTVFSLEVQLDGKVLVGGGFTSISGPTRGGIARLNANGSLDTGFLDGQTGANGVVRSLAVQQDGKVVIGGEFTSVNGQARDGMARLIDANFVRHYSVGQEIPRPPASFVPETNNLTGPVSIPDGGICRDQETGKIYALRSGDYVIRWIDWWNQPLEVSIVVDPLPAEPATIGQELVAPPWFDSSVLPESGPSVTPKGATIWNNSVRKLFALGEGVVGVTWSLAPSACPRVPQQYTVSWPAEAGQYQIHVAGTPAVSLSDGGKYDHAYVYQEPSVGTDSSEVENSLRFQATGAGRSVFLLCKGDPSTSTNLTFQFVKTIEWNDPAYLLEGKATISQEVPPPELHDGTLGGPYVLNPLSRYCAETNFHERTMRTGPIIPVNQDDPSTVADDMVLVGYQKGTKLLDPLSGSLTSSSIGWPYQAVRYDCRWPTNAPTITIASGLGSGPLDTNVLRNLKLYAQNDSTLPGFNPNDEHASLQLTQGSTGEGIFPLRDDLGTAATSEPYCLITYQDGLDGNKPKVKVFKVVAGSLNYTGTAGTLIQPPYPLSLLQKSVESHGSLGPYWRDRKLDFWAKAAGDDGGPTNVVMRWFYPTQPGFYFPSNYFASFPTNVLASPTNVPPAGTRVPWLDLRGGTPWVPHDVTYAVSWPTVLELQVAESLVESKRGLPHISLQSSVEIVYQQASALGVGESVKLIDPTRVVEVTNVVSLPADVATANSGGLTWFPTLPPHLRPRIWYDGLSRSLKFRGFFVAPTAGEYYLLLNVITDRDRQVLLGLSQDLKFREQINELATKARAVIEMPPNAADKPDWWAVTAGLAEGTGYVTLAFGNSTNLTPVNEPVTLEIIKVACPLYRGELKVIESEGPFDEKLTLRHSGDFGGRPGDYVFEWRTLPPVDGLPSSAPPELWGTFHSSPATGVGAVDITIEGSGLFTLTDNYFICRYRPVQQPPPLCSENPGGWSDWTEPQLAPGWIKRVVGDIGPYRQRASGGGLERAETRFENYTKELNTIVSMISQAGPRFEGSIPFNADALNRLGLIEIYQTVLNRGMALSVNASSGVDYPPANDALLLAAGRLSDLYMLLGNEAYADASDPTIAYGTDSVEYGNEASTIHCFQDLTASLLQEELTLLRGRDDLLQPGVKTVPFYNRLIWNFTRGDGEVAYAANYDIRDHNTNGVIDEADARLDYPQGHGDAWGHYLTAIQGYYQLLHNTNFTWAPRTEAVLVGGAPIQVDYMDERKFSKAAAARAQTGAEILGLTHRLLYTEDPAQQWQGYPDGNTNRAWGLTEWGSRAGQGAFFDWVVGNALLPPTNSNTGIQKIDRTTVTELRDIASTALAIQEQMDKADLGLNPLGLTKNTIPFDIDPVQISQGKTHFEQIYDRAVEAMNNAIAVFDHANNSSQQLRRQSDSLAKFQETLADREADFNNRLIEMFGYPYKDDVVSKGGYYEQADVDKVPDLYHYMYSDPSEITGETVPGVTEFTVMVTDMNVGADGTVSSSAKPVKFHLANNGLGLVKPSNWVQPRRAPGEIQRAQSDLLQAKARFERALLEYQNLLAQIEDQADLLRARYDLDAEKIQILVTGQDRQESLNAAIRRSRDRQLDFQTRARTATLVANAVVESFPKIFGVIGGLANGVLGDWTFASRQAVLLAGSVTSEAATRNANRESLAELDHQQAKELAQSQANIQLTVLEQGMSELQELKQLEQLVRQEALSRLELYTMQEAMQQAAGNYASTLARGQRILEDRLRFRQQTAAQVQQYRYNDMAFRIFRNDALQKYRAQFDLAATYVYLAAKAYDYETNLRPGDSAQPGREFLGQIVRARTIGKINNRLPEVGFNGDPGLADPMARMSANFAVLKPQLGINNPQVTVREFSLRSQLLRVVSGTNSSDVWREALARFRVPDLNAIPELRQHCDLGSFQEPGLVIPFATTVNQSLNFFGWPDSLGGTFNWTLPSWKIKSSTVSFMNYRLTGTGALRENPIVYLVPVGSDIMRSPRRFPQDTVNFTREWKILDQVLPVPFRLSGGSDPRLNSPSYLPINDGFEGKQLGDGRRMPALEAWYDTSPFPQTDPQFKSTLLIGRSVWNTKWILVIPGVALNATNPMEGIERFIDGAPIGLDQRDHLGVTDVRIRLEAYSHTGR